MPTGISIFFAVPKKAELFNTNLYELCELFGKTFELLLYIAIEQAISNSHITEDVSDYGIHKYLEGDSQYHYKHQEQYPTVKTFDSHEQLTLLKQSIYGDVNMFEQWLIKHC